ncbi:rod shape-determining protein MreD [Bacillus suaedaesalsae]|uniref:Rod shape-determining protein MreD n=1 Tax=Bacillus suaedaesalsae TaxID=2810349 RepID=A0ABS2DMK8_9BACI|nr:rod shape-determining protein MreD [Bacillus suaedaesalsae]MBM6619745.1 rod shape-determining protein MreD [Bacillus suaedaesalsae]
MRKWFLPTLAFLCFILESVFVSVLPSELFGMERILVPRFVLIIVVFVTMFTNVRTGMIYGFVLGILYDLLYTNLIGVYMFAFTFLAYIVAWIIKLFQINTFTVTFISLIMITLLDFYVYGIQYLLANTSMIASEFLSIRLLPTLILNLAFVIVLFVPLKRQFFKIIDTNNDQ